MKQTVATCPRCGADRVVPILYGFPDGDMMMDDLAGTIELGGCQITDSDPRWLCRACDHRWR